MLEHPGWSGVLAVEEDIVMATNKPVGDNARKGAVRKRSQLKTAPDVRNSAIRGFCKSATGRADVSDTDVRVEVILPWLLQQFAEARRQNHSDP